MAKAIRDNQIEQHILQDSMMHEIAGIRREISKKEATISIHQRLDYQISRISWTKARTSLINGVD
ncbi:hypothetical protein [Thermaerobacillus caldiproteolyticus]|uniref:hypothetical protein n=1 Tax=Thermaerobacillus caldiproteolyticus TaxID=247480 RepID=UPI0018F24D1C|nr:hypothetical protein [Anoxybacillus caldiproteolyticus]